MAVTPKHRRKEAYKSDPMVSLDPERLRDTIKARDWSIQALAKMTENHSQTLDNLVQGNRPKRCRQSRLRTLAEVLRVPEAWLAGTSVAVPELKELPRELAIRMSPRLQLATGELFTKAAKALRRDLSVPEVTDDARRQDVGEEILRPLLFWYLCELLRIDHWRTQLTTWRPPSDSESRLRPEALGMLSDLKDLSTEEEDEVGMGMVAVLEATLAPWFSGEARLDYDRLRCLVGYDRVNAGSGPTYPRYAGQGRSPSRLVPLYALGGPNECA